MGSRVLRRQMLLGTAPYCRLAEAAKLLPEEATGGGYQTGYSLAVEGDRAVVGAPRDDDRGDNAGAVLLFEWDGERWNQAAKVTADDAEAGGQFGHAVALAGSRLLGRCAAQYP